MSQSESNLNKQLSSLLPDTLIELFEIDFSIMQENFERLKDMYGINVGADTIYRFCSSANSTNPVVWKGKSYQPMPIIAEGFESKNDGRFPRPKLMIANPDGIFSRIIYNNNDFVGCKITRKRTYVRFLDDENFQNRNLNSEGKNPFGKSDSDSFLPDDVYYINRKVSEDKNSIAFELSSPLELKDSWLPGRRLYSNMCTWKYRCDIGCGYKGLPIETIDGQNLTENFAFNNNLDNFGSINPLQYPGGIDDIPEWSKFGRTGQSTSSGGYNLSDVVKIIPRSSSNPYKRTAQVFVCIQDHISPADHHPYFDKEFWLKDECSKKLKACKKRFDPNSEFGSHNKSENISPGLRFGAFPGAAGFGYES
jgi:lambda family phage minor tail protein L